MIELKITASEPSELRNTIAGLSALFAGGIAPAVDTSFRGHTAEEAETAAAEQPAPTRQRGKPAEGRARRTREEVAEDEAADKADAAGGETEQQQEEPTAEAERTTVAETPVVETKVEEPKAAETTTVSREDVRKLIVAEAAKLEQAARGDFVQSLLNPFGVKKLGDLPDDKLGALMAAVQAATSVENALD
jgi:hypothetical protein